jgi:hypothetical protein
VAIDRSPGRTHARHEEVEANREARRSLSQEDLELPLDGERARRRRDPAGAQRAEEGDHERRAVRQVETDPVAPLESAREQRPGEPVDRVVELAEAHSGAEEVDRDPFGIAFRRGAKDLVERLVRDADLARHPGLVVGQPGTGGHRSLDSSR